MASVDALIYGTIHNNIDVSEKKDPAINLDISENPDEILKYTNLKRGLCRNGNSIIVNLPIEENSAILENPIDYGLYYDQGNVDFYNKFGIVQKEVQIPSISGLPDNVQIDVEGYSQGTSKCNNFYNIYCENALQDYLKKSGGVYNVNEYIKYKPDCACYIIRPEEIPLNVQRRCWAGPSCNAVDAYYDQQSRDLSKCEFNICTSNIIFDDLDIAGQNVYITTDVKQNCGESGQIANTEETGNTEEDSDFWDYVNNRDQEQEAEEEEKGISTTTMLILGGVMLVISMFFVFAFGGILLLM